MFHNGVRGHAAFEAETCVGGKSAGKNDAVVFHSLHRLPAGPLISTQAMGR